MGILLERFEELASQPHRVPSPFANRGHRKPTQAARDAVHSLKQRQNPLVVEFHSSQKGATIWYELLLENLRGSAATHRGRRLPP
jgi:hypothetical protein